MHPLHLCFRREGVQELPVAKPGVQRRIANLTEAPKECSGNSSEVASPLADSRMPMRSSSDFEEGIIYPIGGLEDGNIPTFLMDQLGPSTATTMNTAAPPSMPQPEKGLECPNLEGRGEEVLPPEPPQVKMNFTITSNDIVEMKIEPDVILAPSDERREKRALPESSFRMKLDKQRRAEEASSSQSGVPPKKRRHDLTADGGSASGKRKIKHYGC